MLMDAVGGHPQMEDGPFDMTTTRWRRAAKGSPAAKGSEAAKASPAAKGKAAGKGKAAAGTVRVDVPVAMAGPSEGEESPDEDCPVRLRHRMNPIGLQAHSSLHPWE